MWPLSPTAAHVELLWCGLRAGMPRPGRVKVLRSDGQVVPSWLAAALMLPSCSASWKARSASARSVRNWLGCQPTRGLSSPSPSPARSPRRRTDGSRRGQRDARSPVELGRVMAEQGRILGDPAHRRPSGPEALQRFAPALQAGASGSARFDVPEPTTGRSWTSATWRLPEPGEGQGLSVAKTMTLDRYRPTVASNCPPQVTSRSAGVRVG